MKAPTGGAVPFLTDSLTRSSLSSCRGPAMSSTRNTKRSERSRSSQVSTKPFRATAETGRASTVCAISRVFSAAVAKPVAIAAIMTASGNAL